MNRQCFREAASGRSLTGQSMCDCAYPSGPCAKADPGRQPIASSDLRLALADVFSGGMTHSQLDGVRDALHAATVLEPGAVKDALLAVLRERLRS